MLQFNELRITTDKKHLIIDVQVQDLPYYTNVYLNTIIVDTQKTYSALGPSSSPLFTIDCGTSKRHREVIDIDGVSDNMFFVYAISTGDPEPGTPCGMDDQYIMGVTYDKYPLYMQGMSLLEEMGGCNPPDNLIDYILQQKAFNISLDTGNFSKAIDYWNNFFNIKEKSVVNKCGCHGRIR